MEKLLVHSQLYNTDLKQYGVSKPFALDRGTRVLEKLQNDLGEPAASISPSKIPIVDVLLVHQKEYFNSLRDPRVWLSIFDLKDGEYAPDSSTRPLNEILDDIRLKCGGTKLATEIALNNGLAANLGGGYHHAFPDAGRGFCALHDIAIAIRALQRDKKIRKAMVVDLDFHQGDGTALIFQRDDNVFTLSVHSKEGWPDEKQVSNLDVEIPEHQSHLYIEKTRKAVDQALKQFSPELVVFVAGSDPYEKDVLPGSRFLNLSLEEMNERDRFVIDTFHEKGIPLAMVFAGGYGPDVWEVHYEAVKHLLARAGQLPQAVER